MGNEKLICNCKDEDGQDISLDHIQYINHLNTGEAREFIVECKKCHRFLKFNEGQNDIPYEPRIPVVD